jgi:dipeptidyl aminopeptidase/acylaminoacyl peptidase
MVTAGRSLAEPRLSPNATCVVFHVRDGGGPRLVRIDLGDDARSVAGPEVTITCDPPVVGVHPFGGGSWCWMPDGDSLLYVAKDGLYRVGRAGGPGELVLANVDGRSFSAPSVSLDGEIVALIAEGDESQWIVTAHTNGRGLIEVTERGSQQFAMDPSVGSAGNVAWHEWSSPSMPWDSSTIGTHTDEVFAAVSVSQPRWSPDGTRLGYLADHDGWLNICVDGTPVIAEAFEHGTPSWGPGQRTWCWSPSGDEVAFVRNESGFGLLCTAAVPPSGDIQAGEVRSLGRAWHVGLSWSKTANGVERLAAIRTGGVTPAQVVVYDLSVPTVDAKPARVTVAHGPAGGWETFDLPEPMLVEWPAADGTTLHGRLYRSREPHGGVIVSCHGGPTDQTLITFNPRYAYWLMNGWTIFVPDYRGSSGWGRAYRQAMNGAWGDFDVSDVVDGVRWLIANGHANAERVVAMGGSAGGFCALHLLLRFPELFRCGVALYPVTDLAALDATTHRFERFYNQTLVGSRSRYDERSPIKLAPQLTRPLLLMHGDADRVVSVEQSQSFARIATDAGASVELVVYADEGHGWRRNETTLDELQRIDGFLGART